MPRTAVRQRQRIRSEQEHRGQQWRQSPARGGPGRGPRDHGPGRSTKGGETRVKLNRDTCKGGRRDTVSHSFHAVHADVHMCL